MFPFDGKDIKAHKWFRGLPWDRLHTLPPPFVPFLERPDDTHYFEDDGSPISDWEESSESSSSSSSPASGGKGEQQEEKRSWHLPTPPGTPPPVPLTRKKEIQRALGPFLAPIRHMAMAWINTPHDAARLKAIDARIAGLPGLGAQERELLATFVRVYGRKKDKKRPRDRLLRDDATRRVVMDLRKRNAFLGYSWRRMRPPAPEDPSAAVEEEYHKELDDDDEPSNVLSRYASDYEGAAGGPVVSRSATSDIAAVRALHRGRISGK